MKISEIKEILNAEVLTGAELLDESVSGAGGADLMADVLSAVAKGGALLTGLTTEHVLRTAKVAEVAVVVFVRGKKPDAPVLELAGVLTFAVDDSRRLKDTVEAAARMAFEGPAATAVLISQQIMGAKTFGK